MDLLDCSSHGEKGKVSIRGWEDYHVNIATIDFWAACGCTIFGAANNWKDSNTLGT